jgi:hypothetical protein
MESPQQPDLKGATEEDNSSWDSSDAQPNVELEPIETTRHQVVGLFTIHRG